MKAELARLFREVELIGDPLLREKVLSVWEEAMKEGGWKLEDLEQIPFTLVIEKAPFNLVEHTRAVTLSAFSMGKAMVEVYGDAVEINFDYLVAGGLLHDVGKLLEYERKDGKFVKSLRGKRLRHPVSGAILAARLGLPEEIQHIIAAHSKEGDFTKRSIEATLVYHADFSNFEPWR